LNILSFEGRKLKNGISVLILSVLLISASVGLYEAHSSGEWSSNPELSRSSSPLSENVTTNEGDLIINGTQTLAIRNCTYIVNGNVYVEDQARLLVSNSLLIINPDYIFRHKEFQIKDYAFVSINDSLIDSLTEFATFISGHASVNFHNLTYLVEMWIACFEDSQVTISNSSCAVLENTHRSEVVVSDSEITSNLGLEFLDPSQTVYLEEIRPGFCWYWNLHQNHSMTNVAHNLTLIRTSINSWTVAIAEDVNVTLKNSELSTIGFEYSNANYTCTGATIGLHGNWTYSGLKLLNTSITGFWTFGVGNSILNLSNSEALLRLTGESNATVRNCTVLLNAWLLRDGRIEFQDTRVEFLVTRLSSFYLVGDIDFTPSTWIQEWTLTNVTRNYEIQLRDPDGVYLRNANLTLTDEHNQTVWTGTSDSLGEAVLNLTFADGNYTKLLRLEAAKGRFFAAENIGFLSETPVSLTLTAQGGPLTFVVPDDYSSIQEAINNAISGDTIFVRSGTYNEHVTVNRSVSLVGESKLNTIVNGTDADDPTVWIQKNNILVTGFQIRNSYLRRHSCIYVDRSNGVHITNNTIHQVCSATASYGILLHWSNHSTVSFNEIEQQFPTYGGGIRLLGSSHNTIHSNTLLRWGNGTEIDLHCINNTLSRNVMREGGRGVFIYDSTAHSNVIYENLIENMFEGIAVTGSNNSIYHNDFVNNSVQASSAPITDDQCDDGYPSGGNYWSDYSDVDLFCGPGQNVSGADGIWDHPYVIYGENLDNYPLTGSWIEVSIEETNSSKGGETYPVQVASNATFFEIKEIPGSLRLNVSGETGTSAYVRIVQPIGLNASNIKVFLNGTRLTFPSTDPPRSISTNGTHYSIYFAFTFNSTYELTVAFHFKGDTDWDGDVDIFDIVYMASAYGVSQPDPRYDPNCDFDVDGDVDIFDIVAAVGNYGESW
jgi:nitrous oxidase accessory protein NosD